MDDDNINWYVNVFWMQLIPGTTDVYVALARRSSTKEVSKVIIDIGKKTFDVIETNTITKGWKKTDVHDKYKDIARKLSD